MWSALSTQHSALSTQHSKFWLIASFILITNFGVSNANATDINYCVVKCASDPKSAVEASLPLLGYSNINESVSVLSACPYTEGAGALWTTGISVNTVEVSECIQDLTSIHEYWGKCVVRSTRILQCPRHSDQVIYDIRRDIGVGWERISAVNLTLTPAPNQKDPRPKGTEGKDPKSSTYELIAKVMEGSSSKAGVAVTFAVEVAANSGGHDHHDASRPKGLVNGALTANGVTDGNGEIKVTFQADQVAGTHVVSAVCDSCTNKSVTKNVDVKVPDLVSLQAGRGYTLEGNTSAVGVNHNGNHYFTESARNNLQKLIDHFNSFGWQPVGINDASLVWGGKFDSKGFWTTGFHDEHRIGEEVDIGFITGTNASKITKGYYEVCREKKVDIPSTILWHDIPKPPGKYDPHFHVRLSGTYTKGPAAGKYAKCDSDSKTK